MARYEQIRARIMTAIEKLGQRCRQIFLLKLDGYNFVEIQQKLGVESINTVRPSYSTRIEGLVRRSCGSEEWHTAQSHPMVGTPIEVPLPSTVSVAFIAREFPRRESGPWADAPGNS